MSLVKTTLKMVAEVHYQLYDVQKQQYLLNELLTVPASRVRSAAHMIVMLFIKQLTGIPGDFSGRIAYVRNSNPCYTGTTLYTTNRGY